MLIWYAILLSGDYWEYTSTWAAMTDEAPPLNQNQPLSDALEAPAQESSPAATPPAAEQSPDPPAADLPAAAMALRVQTVLGVMLALTLGIAAQLTFLQTNEFSWGAVLLYLLAGLIFVGATALSTAAFQSGHEPNSLDRVLMRAFVRLLQPVFGVALWRQLAVVAALLITGGLLYILQRDPPLQDYNWTFWVWLLAMGLYLLAVSAVAGLPRLNFAGMQAWVATHRVAVLGGALLLLAALLLRTWSLATIPQTLGGDEAEQGLEAVRVLTGELKHPFITGWLDVPTMSFYYTAVFIGTLGQNVVGLRLGWALIGVASIVASFLLVRRLFDARLAAVTAGLLTFYHFHLHYSRLGSIQIADVLFVALALLFLYRAYDLRSYRDWALCGLITGFAQYFYAGARLVAVLVVAVVLFLLLRDLIAHGWKILRERYREALVLAGALLISMAPVIQFAIRFPNNYNARVNMVGIFQNGWAEQEMQRLDVGLFAILFEQAKRSFLAFHAYPDRTFWYGSPEPLLDPVSGVLFALGLIYALIHVFDRRMFPMVAWWGGATILGGVLTMDPPSSMRLVTLTAPVMFFVALALVQISNVLLLVNPFGNHHRAVQTAFLSAAVLFLGLTNVRFYFQEYTPLRVYGNYNAVLATDLGVRAGSEFGPDTHLYFFGPPRMYVGFGTIRYLAADVPGTDINDPISDPAALTFVQPDKDAVFVFLPERLGELDVVRSRYPDGALVEVPSPVPANAGEPLYYLYTVPRAQLGTNPSAGAGS